MVDVLTGVHAAARDARRAGRPAARRGGAHARHRAVRGRRRLARQSWRRRRSPPASRRAATATRTRTIVPYQTFEAADGALVVAVGNDEQWRRLCAALDLRRAWRAMRRWRQIRGASGTARMWSARSHGVSRSSRAPIGSRVCGPRASPPGRCAIWHEVMADPALAVARHGSTGRLAAAAPTPLRLLATPWLADGVRPPLDRRPRGSASTRRSSWRDSGTTAARACLPIHVG